VIETIVNEHKQNKERYHEECNAGADVDAEEDDSGTDYLCIHRSKRCQFNWLKKAPLMCGVKVSEEPKMKKNQDRFFYLSEDDFRTSQMTMTGWIK
jgi:hypothetical protein